MRRRQKDKETADCYDSLSGVVFYGYDDGWGAHTEETQTRWMRTQSTSISRLLSHLGPMILVVQLLLQAASLRA